MKNCSQSIVAKRPKCDFCDNEALYDARTHRGPWAFLCEKHFQEHGVGLGIGKGQKMVLDSEVKIEKNVTVDIKKLAEQAMLDGILECPRCGTSIETDCPKCPTCGWLNALMQAGIM